MVQIKSSELETARKLIDNFLQRTGITGSGGNPAMRYLWTDSFAVLCCFALARHSKDERYRETGLKLIEQVHECLGRFRPDDNREGWISGLDEGEGRKHPTAGGLRIGKNLPERKPGETYERQLEWERDGQYFHYLTRWFQALLLAYKETDEEKYVLWSVELLEACEKFIEGTRMYWKMNTDLSAPAVKSMGAHDPLEGMVCALSALELAPGSVDKINSFYNKIKRMCHGMDWFTTDALGVGGLLLNTAKMAGLNIKRKAIPESVHPERLYLDSLAGIEAFSSGFKPAGRASSRLAFRECGLSLGIRVLSGPGNQLKNTGLDFNRIRDFLPLADEIEHFWLDEENRRQESWTAHEDINAVTLASSILARNYPTSFCFTF